MLGTPVTVRSSPRAQPPPCVFFVSQSSEGLGGHRVDVAEGSPRDSVHPVVDFARSPRLSLSYVPGTVLGRQGRTPSLRGEAEPEEGAKGLWGDQCRCLPKTCASRTPVWPLSSPGTAAFELFFVGGASPDPQGRVSALVSLLVEKGSLSCRLCSSPIITDGDARASARVHARRHAHLSVASPSASSSSLCLQTHPRLFAAAGLQHTRHLLLQGCGIPGPPGI